MYSKEGSQHTFQPDSQSKQTAGQISVVSPSDHSRFPDQLRDFQFFEKQQATFAAANILVQEALSDGRFTQDLQELKNTLPVTYDHSVRVSTIAAFLAIDAGFSAELQYRTAVAGSTHDLGKLDEAEVRWDSYQWTADEIEQNATAVINHPHHSAKRVAPHDESIILPVLLHHAFQQSPYPDLEDYKDRLTEETLRVARFIALADQTEATFTRSRSVGMEKSEVEVIRALSQHSYTNLQGESEQRAFSDDEILKAITAYQLLDTYSSHQAA